MMPQKKIKAYFSIFGILLSIVALAGCVTPTQFTLLFSVKQTDLVEGQQCFANGFIVVGNGGTLLITQCRIYRTINGTKQMWKDIYGNLWTPMVTTSTTLFYIDLSNLGDFLTLPPGSKIGNFEIWFTVSGRDQSGNTQNLESNHILVIVREPV